MDAIATGLISGLLVVFVAWLAKSTFLSRRLFLIQPRLFDYTELGDAKDTRTIELTIFNGGTRVEESIKLQLSPAFRYSILASSSSGLAVDAKGVMQLDRLSPKQEMTVVLTAEGGEFRKEHVMGISSKDVVGKIKDSLQEAQLTPAQNVAIAALMLLILPIGGYFAGTYLVAPLWDDVSPHLLGATDESASVEFEITRTKLENFSSKESRLKTLDGALKIVSVTRTGGLVELEIAMTNPFDERISVTAMTATPVSEERPASADYIVANVLVFPHADKRIKISDYLPRDAVPQLVMLEVSIDDSLGRLVIERDILIK